MRLNEYWPRFLQELVEFGEIARAEQPEFDAAGVAVEEMPLEFSAFTLTAYGVRRWEKTLGIVGKEAEGLEARRFRIQSIVMDQIPITKRTLYQQLQTLCGEGNFTMTIDCGGYSVGIYVAVVARSAFDDVDNLVRKSLPANMTVVVSLLYNKYGELRQFSHDELSARTHDELRNEVLPNV